MLKSHGLLFSKNAIKSRKTRIIPRNYALQIKLYLQPKDDIVHYQAQVEKNPSPDSRDRTKALQESKNWKTIMIMKSHMLKTKTTEHELMGMTIDRHYFVDVKKKSRPGEIETEKHTKLRII